MVDRVKPLKIETSNTGTEDDEFPTEVNPAEDFLDTKGIALQRHTGPGETDHTDDENVLISRDSFENMTFTDSVVSETKTLTQLLEASDILNRLVITTWGGLVYTKDEFNNIQLVVMENT